MKYIKTFEQFINESYQVNEGRKYPVSSGVRFDSSTVFKEGDKIEADVDGKTVGLFDLLLKRNYFDGFNDISLYRQGISPNKKYMVISTASIRGRKNIKISAPFSGFMILDEDSIAVVMRKNFEGVWVNTMKENPDFFVVKDDDWHDILFDTNTGKLLDEDGDHSILTKTVEKTYTELIKNAENEIDAWSWVNTGSDIARYIPKPLGDKLSPMNASVDDIKKHPVEMMYGLFYNFCYNFTDIHAQNILRLINIEFEDPKGPDTFYNHKSTKKVIKKYEKKLMSIVANTQAEFIDELKAKYAGK
jgi:hypothetical protein